MIGYLDNINMGCMSGGGGVYHTSGGSHNSTNRDNNNINSHRDPAISPKSTDLDSMMAAYSRPRYVDI